MNELVGEWTNEWMNWWIHEFMFAQTALTGDRGDAGGLDEAHPVSWLAGLQAPDDLCRLKVVDENGGYSLGIFYVQSPSAAGKHNITIFPLRKRKSIWIHQNFWDTGLHAYNTFSRLKLQFRIDLTI